jgi:nucleoside-diphosphate-sugar epimerase
MRVMKVLLIGGTGNISSECASLLYNQGHEVLILTRGKTPVPPAYRAVVADRKDIDSMRAAIAIVKPDVAINFIGFEVADLEIDFAVLHGRIQQYIFISSTTVYSRPPAKLPMIEDLPLGNRFWDYAQKKIDCEEWLNARAKADGFPVTIVRPAHTYSKLWVPNAISSGSYTFASRLEQGKPVFIHDDGETRWTLTHASDFAVGLAGLVGNKSAIAEAFHITGDEVLTWNQIYQEIADAVGAKSPQIVTVPAEVICGVIPSLSGNLRGDKAHPGVFDNSKIKRFVPGFGTTKPFREGVRESVAWLRAHPEQQNLKPEVDALIEAVLKF